MKFWVVLIGCFSISNTWAYRISGSFPGIEKCWYPRVYLAVIDNVNGFYTADYRNTIAEAEIDPAGNFVLEGNDLPDGPMFYRLYFTNGPKSKTFIRVGAGRSYLLLVLNNQSTINLTSPSVCSNYFEYTVEGSEESIAAQNLQHVLDGFKGVIRDSLGEAKKNFIEEKYLQTLYAYADSSPFLMTALWALTETEITENYDGNQGVYDRFLAKFKEAYPGSVYAKQLDDIIRVEAFKLQPETKKPFISIPGVVLVIVLLLSGLLNLYYFKTRKAKTQAVMNEENDQQKMASLIAQLTIKEREILMMIDSGLSNKEIADKLNVELSTIKTHVSRIYQKTNIRSRKEVRQIVRHMS